MAADELRVVDNPDELQDELRLGPTGAGFSPTGASRTVWPCSAAPKPAELTRWFDLEETGLQSLSA